MTGAAPLDMLGSLGRGRYPARRSRLRFRRLREDLAARGAWANIKPMHRRNVPAFCAFLYRYRNLVERFFNKLKHFRAVATRYDKDSENYLASVKLASSQNLDAV